jgi:uncharacterized MAPEG superfamily protein
MELAQHPAFRTFVACAAILVLKMALVGHWTGILRLRRRAYLNPEDARAVGAEVRAQEDPEVERGLRAHRNDLESTLPFLAIGLPYLWTNPSPGLAQGLFVTFTALRAAHSVCYLRGWQPWRTLAFLAAEVCVLVMLVQMLAFGLAGQTAR